MDKELKKTDDEIKRDFFKLKTRQDVASLLEISDSTLIYHLYRKRPSYITFLINKKSGGKRLIEAPENSIRILQRKFNKVLDIIYKNKNCVHGFASTKSIASNAKNHLSRNFILNIDLKDFFPSINFGRVRGALMSEPFNLTSEVSTILAQLCCYNNHLPQGAPTSPSISNIICRRLDNELRSFLHKHKCRYTRYADDITISSNIELPESIVFYEEGVIFIGKLLEKIINDNGFEINYKKLRLQNSRNQQIVTGIKVNSILNVNKKLINQIRAMLHARERFGQEKANKEYNIRYKNKQTFKKNDTPFDQVLRGKIEFIGFVRGKKDKIYRKFLNHFNELLGNGKEILPLDNLEDIYSKVYIIKSGSETGTAFMLKDYGLITSAHCINDENDIKVFTWNNWVIKSSWLDVKIKKIDKAKDIAILEIDNMESRPFFEKDAPLKVRDEITTVGFSFYELGHKPTVNDGKVKLNIEYKGTERMIVTQTLFSGESGGPALNLNNKVVGIIVNGSGNYHDNVFDHSVVCINELENML